MTKGINRLFDSYIQNTPDNQSQLERSQELYADLFFQRAQQWIKKRKRLLTFIADGAELVHRQRLFDRIDSFFAREGTLPNLEEMREMALHFVRAFRRELENLGNELHIPTN